MNVEETSTPTTADTDIAPAPLAESPPNSPVPNPPVGTPANPQSRGVGKAVLREIVETVVLFAVIFTVARFAIGNFIIIGTSMEPNYHEDQRLLVDRLAPKLGWLQRGDVVVLHSPSQDEPTIDLIKRLIGLPGDTIEIRDNQIFVNGAVLPEPYLPAGADTSRGLPGGQSQWVLGPGEYLVLGDNRSASKDGRYFGPVNDSLLIGRALVVYYPFSDFRLVQHHKYE
jgi:signal peptidase I